MVARYGAVHKTSSSQGLVYGAVHGKERNMKELRASTKAGQNIIARANNNIGTSLEDAYKSYSIYKARAYRWCREQFEQTECSNYFHICSANTCGFTVAWEGIKDGKNILRYETKDNTYLVWLDR